MFDPKWAAEGHTDRVIELFSAWVAAQAVPGLTLEVMRAEGRTPLLFLELAATGGGGGTVLMYGHLDKQPPMAAAWAEGLHPYKPVVRDGKLYGRGGADDGYAIFGAVTALAALEAQGVAHGRAVIIIEACEESGSPDLPQYVMSLKARIGTPTLIVCLDSGCGNYDQMWITTNLRGLVGGNLRVTILKEAVHSGSSSGVVPSSFRIARQLLSRVEDEATGRVLLPELHCAIPPDRVREAGAVAAIMGDAVYRNFPWVEGAAPAGAEDHAELLLRRTWRPALSVTGAAGFPSLEQAGNVLRTETAFKLSMRLPPRCEAEAAGAALKAALEARPPHGAHVAFELEKSAGGWDAPASAPWLAAAVDAASLAAFGRAPAYFGEGGSIPFMGMLGELFPQAQFVVTGVLGPGSNAHGPNEFLHIDFTKRIIQAVALILAAHAQQPAASAADEARAAGAMQGRVDAANADRAATLQIHEAKGKHEHMEGCCP
jgi:acetylornithine deacetylase/succinyl-diaminopimelate desuccinylase-like protein